jgi:hypothetical protein
VYAIDGTTTISNSCILNNTAPDGVEIGKAGNVTVTATGNWWGSDGVGASAGAGVIATSPLAITPVLCQEAPPTPTPSPTPAPLPTLIAPANEGVLMPAGTATTANIAFSWTYAGSAAQYTVQIDNDPAFGSVQTNQTCTTVTLTCTINGVGYGTYHWRVLVESHPRQSSVSALPPRVL